MKKLVIILLWLLLLCGLVIFSVGIMLYLDWPRWTALAVFLGGLFFVFLGKYIFHIMGWYKKNKTRHAVDNISDQINIVQSSLTRSWKSAITLLRESSLKKRGNPIFVLPWFMMLGASGSGKTTILRNARLTSPVQEGRPKYGMENTHHCEWWYFEKAVIIDCAEQSHEDNHRQEWDAMMNLLTQYRPREGIDGVVLALNVECFMQKKKDDLLVEGRLIRLHIDQLIQKFGKRFPIYLLLTKCDCLYGFEEWSHHFSEGALRQAMGYLAEDNSRPGGEKIFLDAAFDSIGNALSRLRLHIMEHSTEVNPQILLFPQEVENLQYGLFEFLQTCFADDSYLERPFLRGLFFSSGIQAGGATSSLQYISPSIQHGRSDRGLFAHDFFENVLPGDRYISLPTEHKKNHFELCRNLCFFSWMFLCSLIGVAIAVAFIGNVYTINMVNDDKPFDTVFKGYPAEDISSLEKIAHSLILIEQRNKKWSVAWMANTSGMDRLQESLRTAYISYFQKYIASDGLVEDEQNTIQSDKYFSSSKFPRLLLNIVRDINILQARLDGANREELEKMPQRQPMEMDASSQQQRINRLLISYLAWSNDPAYYAERLHANQKNLEKLAYADPQMKWLTGVVTDRGAIPGVHIDDFWGRDGALLEEKGVANTVAIPAAFTKAGWLEIKIFLAEMERSVPDKIQFMAHRKAFERWYHEKKFIYWGDFLKAFLDEQEFLLGESTWRKELNLMGTAQSPYARFIARLNEEFEGMDDIDGKAPLPQWILLVRKFYQLQIQAMHLDSVGKSAKIIGAVNAVGGVAIRETLQGDVAAGERTVKENLEQINSLQSYLKDVRSLVMGAIAGTANAYQIAADFHQFGKESSVKVSLPHVAFDRLNEFKRLMGDDNPENQMVWKLIAGPLDFVLHYIEQQASCELQKKWQSSVQRPLQTVSDKAQMLSQLYGTSGTVWKFVENAAGPFLERDARYYKNVETLGYQLPFTVEFLSALNTAIDKRMHEEDIRKRLENSKREKKLYEQQLQVTSQQAILRIDNSLQQIRKDIAALKVQRFLLMIEAQPTSVNMEAKVKPFSTILSLQCANDIVRLNNYNFPVHQKFQWMYEQCGDVSLEIKLGKMTLKKYYPGALGMINFISDFRDGEKRFYTTDFPTSEEELEELGVHWIGVHYNFKESQALFQAAQRLDQLEKMEKDRMEERQGFQEQIFQRDQDAIQDKIADEELTMGAASNDGSGVWDAIRSSKNMLPSYIAACWR